MNWNLVNRLMNYEMKKTIKSIAMPLIAMALCWACAQDERLMFDQPASVYFYKWADYDSISYTFATRPESLVKDTVYLPVRLFGDVAAHDRLIRIAAADTSSAKAGYHYELGQTVLPAHAVRVDIPVYIYRRAGLKDSTVVVNFLLAESDELGLGYPINPRGAQYVTPLEHKLYITDILQKPANWEGTWRPLFGEYSEVKFRFLIGATGRVVWTGAVYPQDSQFMAQKARLELISYVEANGPLIDEFGDEVVFP